MSVCKNKSFYDTEFQAQVVAARRTSDWGAEIIHYPCGSHWHVANEDPSKRGKHIRLRRDYCEYCDSKMRESRYANHIERKGHLVKKAAYLNAQTAKVVRHEQGELSQ